MLGLFCSKASWQQIPHGEGDFGDLKLHDDGSLSIGRATFSNVRLNDTRIGDYLFNFDGKNLSIRGPQGLARFRYKDNFWYSYIPN